MYKLWAFVNILILVLEDALKGIEIKWKECGISMVLLYIIAREA